MTARMRSERGAGLLEMLIAVTLLTIVMATMVGVLLQQQRFYLVAGDSANTVSILQRVEAVVSAELLPLNAAAGDVIHADLDSVKLRAFRGVYAVCDKREVTDAELTVRSLSGGLAIPVDSALVYSHGLRATVADDHWKPVAITAVQPDTCPDSTPAWTATVPALNGDLGEIPIGGPVRAFHWSSYWLTTQDGSWFMKSDALSGSPMVVSGPLAPSDSASASVLSFRYIDWQGDPTATITEIERIEIDVMALGVVPTTRGGLPMRKNRTVSVKLRNAVP